MPALGSLCGTFVQEYRENLRKCSMPHCREQGGHSAQYTFPDLAGKDGMQVGLNCFAVGRSKLLVNESDSGCLRWCLDRCRLC